MHVFILPQSSLPSRLLHNIELFPVLCSRSLSVIHLKFSSNSDRFDVIDWCTGWRSSERWSSWDVWGCHKNSHLHHLSQSIALALIDMLTGFPKEFLNPYCLVNNNGGSTEGFPVAFRSSASCGSPQTVAEIWPCSQVARRETWTSVIITVMFKTVGTVQIKEHCPQTAEIKYSQGDSI